MKTITGNWILPNGSAVANGILYLSLSADAVATPGIAAPKVIQVPLNSSGSIPASTTILANDELTPAGTLYTLVVNQAGGGRVWGPEIYSLTGASPININSFTPTAAGGPNYPAPVLQTPSAAQTITGFSLSLAAGQVVSGGITADSLTASGQVGAATLSASGNVLSGTLTISAATATAASAGSHSLPASPTGFLVLTLGATTIKVPFYSA